MKSIILACVVCLHLGWSYGSDDTDGVGAFAYQDSTGNRYGGTYGLRDGQVVNQQGNLPPNFSPPTFTDLDDFFPDYFNNLQYLLQEVNPFIPPSPLFRPPQFRKPIYKPFFKRTFESSVENQKQAFDTARKAFDLTSNQAGYIPNFTPSRFPFGGDFPAFGGFPGSQGFPGAEGFAGHGAQGFPGQGFPGFQMPNSRSSYENSAFAGAALGPDYVHQVANISPANPNNPNINKQSHNAGSPGGYKSVSSSSYVSSSDVDGHKSSSRRAETTINDNGKITKYKVES